MMSEMKAKMNMSGESYHRVPPPSMEISNTFL